MVLLGRRQPGQTVLHHDHGTVDDQAKIDGAQAHQIATDPVGRHAGEREQHAQWDDRGGDQGGTEVAQQGEQHHDHQQRAFEQVFLHRGDGFFDQRGAIVHRLGTHTVG